LDTAKERSSEPAPGVQDMSKPMARQRSRISAITAGWPAVLPPVLSLTLSNTEVIRGNKWGITDFTDSTDFNLYLLSAAFNSASISSLAARMRSLARPDFPKAVFGKVVANRNVAALSVFAILKPDLNFLAGRLPP
jgi:hypothetical protein